MLIMDAEANIAAAYARYQTARALSAGWQVIEVLHVTTRRYTDDVLEHEVDLTLAGNPEADVTTVRVHSRVDGWTDAAILDVQRVIARTSADAQVRTECDEAIDDSARTVIESLPDLIAIIERVHGGRNG